MSVPKKCLSIDVGNQLIKITELVRTRKGIRVLKYGMMPTPKQALQDGFITNQEAVVATILQIIKEHRMGTKSVIFTVSSSKIITREVDLPILNYKKLSNIIQMNASEYFPVNLNDYLLDHYIVDTVTIEGQKKYRVNVVAAQSELMERYVAVASQARLKLEGFDYAGLSFSNFALKYGDMNGVNLFIEIGYATTMVAIIHDNVVKFNRVMPTGCSVFIEVIKKQFEVEEQEAIWIAQERPLLTNQQDRVYVNSDLIGAVNGILNGVDRLIDYYTSRNETAIDRVYLLGGGATIKGMDTHVEQHFKKSTMMPNDFRQVVKGAPTGFEDEQIFYVNTIGAMMSTLTLVPKSIVGRENARQHRRVIFLIAMLFIVPMTLMTVLKIEQIYQTHQAIQQVEQDIESASRIIALKATYIDVTERVAFRQGIATSTEMDSDYFVEVLDLLETITPQDLFFTALVDTGTGFSMTGIAKDKLTVAAFIVALKEAGYLDVLVPGLEDSTALEETPGFVGFSLTASYGGETHDESE